MPDSIQINKPKKTYLALGKVTSKNMNFVISYVVVYDTYLTTCCQCMLTYDDVMHNFKIH